MKRAILAAATAALVGAAVAAAPAEPRPRKPATYTIVIDKMAFGPPPSSLYVGDTVTWSNHDFLRHTATADDHSFDVDLPPGKTASVRLVRAGHVAFSCTFHPGMRGILLVTP